MCILFLAIETHPDYPLIICANRDEFHHRPTQPAHLWSSENNLIAGKDLQAGGTWLGLSQQGQFAGLTNLRVPALIGEDLKSRGELVIKALSTDKPLESDWLETHCAEYNPFNLVFNIKDQFFCFNSITKTFDPLSPGFHAISNGAMDDTWPKMAKGEQALEALIQNGSDISIDELIALMKDETQPDDDLLPSTGIALEWERRLSSIYIRHPEYGTRSTSIILKNNLGQYQFVEVRYDGKGRQLGRQDFTIKHT